MSPEGELGDPLDDLKAALRAAEPRPDPRARAAHLALAQENFGRLQAADAGPRPTSRRIRVWRGARDMLTTLTTPLTTRRGLTATTALVACGLLLVTPAGQDLWRRAPAVAERDPGTAVATDAATEARADPAPYAAGQAAEAEVPAVPSQDRDRAVAPESPATTDQVAAGRAEADDAAPAETAPAGPTAPLDVPAANARLALDGLAGSASGAAPTAEADAYAAPSPALAPLAQVVPEPMVAPWPLPDAEAFANADENPLKVTAQEPVSTFSIDVDTASYAVVRRSLAAGQMPPPEAVRVEELVNYFPYAYPAPLPGEGPFRPTVSVMPTPWNPGTRLVAVAIQGEMPAVEDRPPLNLVFLIDTSGSMDAPDRLPLLKQSFRLLVDQLRPEDEVAIVTYAGSAGLVLPPTQAGERSAILRALNDLAAGGSTNGQGGLDQAYDVVEGMAAEGEVGRVVLATDGDFNVGLSDPSALEDFIADRRDSGAFLSVLGFGRGNLDDATMQALAQAGNGQAAYIDTLSEAQKVLVDQLAGALYPIAQDVKVQVEWNPAAVAEYRLLGYETRALAREDFNDDRVDAGELGAGHSVTAIYEVTPTGSPAQLTDPLRYAAEDAAAAPAEVAAEWGFLRLRWKEPGGARSALLETPITGAEPAGTEARFAAAVAGWGQLLRGSDRLGDWDYADVIALAAESRGEDPFGWRTEAVQLMRLSESLAE